MRMLEEVHLDTELQVPSSMTSKKLYHSYRQSTLDDAKQSGTNYTKILRDPYKALVS